MMKPWQEDVIRALNQQANQEAIFCKLLEFAQDMGFEHCAYGLRLTLPITNPRFFLVNNYPAQWRERYATAGYLLIDPTVEHGRRSQTPIVWSNAVFARAGDMWTEAQDFGLKFGLAQSTFDGNGGVGMVTFARSRNQITEREMDEIQDRCRWLVNATHDAFSRVLAGIAKPALERELTSREIEILKWMADGKTSKEASEILSISLDTVNFHMKNAIAKLGSTNKTAAVVRAVVLGLLG